MSFDALAWAAKQKPGNLAAKMVLLALANYANEAGEAYPSTAAIAEFGDMNHKTATAALDRLESLGMIADTGKKQGRSGQIKVYRLALESLPKTEASQKRKPPVFSAKDPQKRVTDTVKEPSTPLDTANAVSPPSVENDDLTSDEVVEAWNALAADVGLPVVAKLTKERKRKLACRIRDHPFEEWASALAAIRRSRFLQGDNQRGWRANFDFLLQPSSFTKLLEGQYDEQAKAH